jgi:sterol desaturase/sphingolipid hydroxylase (fatty acid hydroxylase superfamily)
MSVEPLVRLACFVGVLVAMAFWEAAAPRRKLVASRPARWLSNLGLVAINTVLLRVAFVLGLAGVAAEAAKHQWGLLNNVALPLWLQAALAVVLLDLAIYLQHVLFHAVPLLWRLHMVHHADPDFDVTTGVRFHTLEVLLSTGIKAAAIVLLGVPPLGVIVFEILLNATSMFNHSNVRMPLALDRLLRLLVVTPEMHRVHHSTIASETNSNFGFNLPWWDYLLGTYRAQPRDGHEKMAIGLTQIPRDRAVGLHWLLLLPFIGRTGEYAINERAPASRR